MNGSGGSQNDMTLRRGFVKEANEIARDMREELGLSASAPLSPWDLADHLDIPVLGMSTLSREAPSAVVHFARKAQSDFSGVTVFKGTSRIIIHNDSHAPGRQASDVSHEIAHALLGHQPAPALDDLGCRFWDGGIEEEAERLGGILLITEEAALSIVRRGLSPQAAAVEYGVSQQMVTWRLRMTKAHVRVA